MAVATMSTRRKKTGSDYVDKFPGRSYLAKEIGDFLEKHPNSVGVGVVRDPSVKGGYRFETPKTTGIDVKDGKRYKQVSKSSLAVEVSREVAEELVVSSKRSREVIIRKVSNSAELSRYEAYVSR